MNIRVIIVTPCSIDTVNIGNGGDKIVIIVTGNRVDMVIDRLLGPDNRLI